MSPVLASSFWYPKACEKAHGGTINVGSGGDTLVAILVDTSSSCATDDTAGGLSEITTLGELTGGNYARQTLANQSINISQIATGVVFFDADDPAWANLTATNIAGCLIFDDTEANDQPLVYLDFGAPQSITADTFTVELSSTGYGGGTGMGNN